MSTIKHAVYVLAIAFLVGSSAAQDAVPVGAAFTYQGQLKEDGVPASGFYDFMFSLYDVPQGGTPISFGASASIVLLHQDVQNGLFTVELDFGAAVFQEHDELWLAIGVRPDVTTPFTILSPRQRIDSTPRATVAKYAESTAGGSLSFGDTARTSLGVHSELPGLTAMDPVGMRVMNMTTFGRCRISGEPCMVNQHCPQDETCDPCDTCTPLPTMGGSMFFGMGNSRIGVEAGLSGLAISDTGGVRLLVAGAHICEEEYPNWLTGELEVKYCEYPWDCYGCCTRVKHCWGDMDDFCGSHSDCQTGRCEYSGADCHADSDCAPGKCIGGETCEEDWACSRHCQSDADCPGEGSFCDFPPPSNCVSPEGRCSGNNFACHADTDCPPGHCLAASYLDCWRDESCWANLGYGVIAYAGPCVGAESCRNPILGRQGKALALHFGESDDHAFGFDPGLQRLVAVDPRGLSLVSHGRTCSGTGRSCESDTDCPVGGCSHNGYACRSDADCFGATGSFCTNPHPQTCESDANGLKVFFGSDGGTSIGTEPALGGLVLRSQGGARIVAPSTTGAVPASARLFFGETAASPYIEEDQEEGGLRFGGHSIKMFDPQPEPPGKLLLSFGLAEATSIGTDPSVAGLILRDPTGVRLLNSMNPDENALIFGSSSAGGGVAASMDTRIDTGIASDGMRFNASSFFFDGGPVGIGTVSPGRLLQIGTTSIPNSQGMIRLASRSGTQGSNRTWDIGVPETDADSSGYGYSFVIDDINLGSDPEFMVKWGSGNVGIGTSAPGSKLGVKGGGALGAPAVATFDRTGSDGVILGFQRDGATVGTISVSGGVVSYNSFTGSHLGSTDTKLDRGDLVRLTGANSHQRGDPASEIVYGIARSTHANDPRCLGAYLDEHQAAESGDHKDAHLVMAEGNGEMWVVDTGDDIQPGDYLISSDVPGCAMKDDARRFAVGYVVARAAESVHWAGVDPNEQGIRKTRISVFFDGFVRGSDTAPLAAEVSRLGGLVESQRSTIEVLERKLSSLQEIMDRLSRLEKSQPPGAGSADSDPGGTR